LAEGSLDLILIIRKEPLPKEEFLRFGIKKVIWDLPPRRFLKVN